MIDVRVEDLAFFSGDAIIRPATATLGATTPLLRRLELAGGAKLMEQLRVSEPLPVGGAVVTGAGDLPVELLVHAIVSSLTERVTRDGVRRAFRSALEQSNAWQLAAVAVPPLGLGAGNLDLEASAELMADELVRHRRTFDFPRRVTLVAETRDEAMVLELYLRRAAA
ncbi:MAG: putative phosphatase, C-terminal domain of histone macro like protein [Gemmatimonadetes bacterium]|jgi:O-acetyl-ADP-ribose deacetylase (regulator of RNase III)|nr:putative phosphatase, C-terminal domain of histone macro like protein [Gemmatimonadota bacterium]